MRSYTTIPILLLLIKVYSYNSIPVSHKIFEGPGKDWNVESERLEGNFILDIIENRNKGSEPDTAVFVATGAGFSLGYNTLGVPEELKWRNSRVGYGGSSAIAADNFGNIWMTTAKDTFIVDDKVFLPMGTGVHMSPDSGRTWQHFPQPGVTPIQGLTYDIACAPAASRPDSVSVWMACFGQSLQVSDDSGVSWRTVVCGGDSINPLAFMNQRIFSVHFTEKGKLWAGTAEGINLCAEHNVPDSERKWKQFTYKNGLTGNFVTAVKSYYDTEEDKEHVFAASWFAGDQAEVNGVSFTVNDGLSWNKCLIGEKVYNFGFKGKDVYACGDTGLWKSSDGGYYWEKYVINAWSGIKRGYVSIEKVYSFLYQNNVMFAGTGQGMVVSGDDGNSWYVIEAYEPSSDSKNDTYAYPNPFSPVKFGEVKLQFRSKDGGQVTCEIYNYAMERVRTVVSSAYYGPGEHYLVWDGKDSYGKTAANGVYFYIISSGEKKIWNKIIIFE